MLVVSRDQDHPRIRGEHCTPSRDQPLSDGSSPHTRGARASAWPGDPRTWIIPAYAGSTTPTDWRSNARADHPRIRGEHIGAAAHQIKITGSSPHTRGAQQRSADGGILCRIIPAYAGSTPAATLRPFHTPDHPRIRGEHATMARRAHMSQRIIPAYAGSTCLSAMQEVCGKDHPRIRGEHSRLGRPVLLARGSSPHTRGALRSAGRSGRRRRIIPAYAGSTRFRLFFRTPWSDHPRIRGEHVHIEAPRCPQMGSSPHTRGARCR